MTARPNEGVDAAAGPSGRRVVALGRGGTASLLREVIRRGGSVALPVKGSSMHPAIRSGDVVTIAPKGPGPLPVGAVVAAEARGAGGLVVHRLVGRRGANVLLRGDNGERADGEVAESAVIGVVACVTRDGRRLASAPAGLRRALAALVRAGLVRRCNRALGRLGRWVPRGRRKVVRDGAIPPVSLIGFAAETKSR